MTIWKFPLDVADVQTIHLPADHKMLSAQFQDGILCVWVLVDPNARKVRKKVRVVGTGHDFDDHADYVYVGTVQQGRFVWHVFVEN